MARSVDWSQTPTISTVPASVAESSRVRPCENDVRRPIRRTNASTARPKAASANAAMRIDIRFQDRSASVRNENSVSRPPMVENRNATRLSRAR